MNDQIKEGDYVSVPPINGKLVFGQVLYITGAYAVVQRIKNAKGKAQYRVSDLHKIAMKTEAEIRREYDAQEKA